MAVTHGANVEVLDELAEQLSGDGHSVEQIHQSANVAVGTLREAWLGGDMEGFAQEWSSREPQLADAQHSLQTMAQALREQADQQRTASGAGGGGLGGLGGVLGGLGVIGGAVGAAGLTDGGWSFGDVLGGLTVAGSIGLGAAGLFSKGKGLATFFRSAEGMAAAGARLLSESKINNLVAGATRFLGGADGLAGRLGGIAGKLGVGATLVGGVMSAITGDGYDGWRGGTSRVLGTAGAIGAGATLFAADTALMATGVGAPIAIGAMAVYGAWELGNLIYDHWDGITAFAGDAVSWAGDRLSDVGQGVDNAVSWAGDRLSDVGEGISNVVDSVIPDIDLW